MNKVQHRADAMIQRRLRNEREEAKEKLRGLRRPNKLADARATGAAAPVPPVAENVSSAAAAHDRAHIRSDIKDSKYKDASEYNK